MSAANWFWMTAMMLVFWGVVVWAIVGLARSTGGSAQQRASTPEAILRERFARGEVDEQEYERRLDALRHTAPRR